ncbi:G-protein coupled receptor 55a [Pygocentrus nattereri]|uniref:G-protein coupled receptors family 1 profile domain-containing protein n=1 Tax=Pygocentrus nattereri TaxID=42514 RepID=A0A3B4EHV6_PYGNA|nr:G-protein coupled receptor 55a [Pygocentrus nattereri]
MLTEVSMSSCDWVCLMQLLVYVPVLVLGIPLNLAALWKLLSIRRWRESTVYLLNLIINDTLLLLSLPFKIHAYNRNWHLGRPFCSLLESLVYVNVYGSILLSVCIAGDRFVALRFPFAARRLRSPLKSALICLVIWMLVFSCSYPVYSLNHDNTSSSFCFQNFSNRTWENRWIVVSMETVFCCSTVVMVFCSVQVVRLLRDLRKRNPNDPKLRNNKSVKIVLSNLLAFLICFIPYHIAALLYFHYKNSRPGSVFIRQLRYFVHSSLCVGSVNCLADGACYYYILKENLHTAKLERRATLQSTHIRHKNVQSHNQSTEMVREESEESRDPQRLKNGSSNGSFRGKN